MPFIIAHLGKSIVFPQDTFRQRQLLRRPGDAQGERRIAQHP
jgi:hypothetical protein